MTPSTPYSYEIEFDVIGACRDDYDCWMAENSIGWVSHKAVTTFDVWHNDKGMSPEVRFVFGFQSLKQWASFVNSDVHASAKDALKQVTTGLNAQLWERSSIQLSQDACQEKTALSPCDDLPAVSEELL